MYYVCAGGAAAQKASKGAQDGAKRAAANSVSGITLQVNTDSNLTVYGCYNVHLRLDLLNSDSQVACTLQLHPVDTCKSLSISR